MVSDIAPIAEIQTHLTPAVVTARRILVAAQAAAVTRAHCPEAVVVMVAFLMALAMRMVVVVGGVAGIKKTHQPKLTPSSDGLESEQQ